MARILLLTTLALGACMTAPTTTTTPDTHRSNPFFKESPLPFFAPPFDRIEDSDYQPALEAGMAQQMAEIGAIADNPAAPTFANTMVAMERSGRLLDRVSQVFFAVAQANTNPVLQKVETEEAPKLAAHHDAIFLNAKLFARIKTLYDARATLDIDPEGKVLIEHVYGDFVRAGALLSEADKTTLRALNQEESRLTTELKNKLLAATAAGAVIVDDVHQLEGLSDGDVAAAAQAAKARHLDGKWLLPLQNTTQQPPQKSLANHDVRKRLFQAAVHRADGGGKNDVRPIVLRLATLRADKAKLLGFPSFAAYRLGDQMAKTPEAAEALLTRLVPAATAKARAEMAKMQALIDRGPHPFPLAAWDWQYYAEKVRKAEYDLDDSQVRPYFELDRVLRDGVFFAAHELYGLTFEERSDLPVYAPGVRVFEVFDADKTPLALFYADYFARDNKAGGAWMSTFVSPSGLLGQKAVVFNVCNFAKPAPGKPALLTFTEVTTMFHEFGHALHGMLSEARYPSLAGTHVPRDFVEFPSQFNEHWASEPHVLAHYARHYETGAAMPDALMAKILESQTFNQGFATTEYLAAALIDLAWHTLPANAEVTDVNAFEKAALSRFHIDLPQVPPRYHTTYFAHIWEGGYQAAYYAYLWSEVLDDDAYQWFEEHGGLRRENGERFRKMILSRGHTGDLGAMYRAFRGRDPSIEALLSDRGLK
ncbi:MAG TPA: M3 family metallopeptidase [Kofleriaceae bacterium]|nr:M3 family metallopeptidase [Kofleriaceae bacterium]